MSKHFRIYKPKNGGGGCASSLELKSTPAEYGNDFSSFWVFATQIGNDENDNNAFAWKEPDKAITVKMGVADFGAILALLNGRLPAADLFHKNAKGNTVVKITKNTGEKGGYFVNVSRQVDGEVLKLSHSLTWAEGELLRVVVNRAILGFYDLL